MKVLPVISTNDILLPTIVVLTLMVRILIAGTGFTEMILSFSITGTPVTVATDGFVIALVYPVIAHAIQRFGKY